MNWVMWVVCYLNCLCLYIEFLVVNDNKLNGYVNDCSYCVVGYNMISYGMIGVMIM